MTFQKNTIILVNMRMEFNHFGWSKTRRIILDVIAWYLVEAKHEKSFLSFFFSVEQNMYMLFCFYHLYVSLSLRFFNLILISQ